MLTKSPAIADAQEHNDTSEKGSRRYSHPIGLDMVGQPARLAVSGWSSQVQLVARGFIIFLVYEGFELLANATQDARDPHKTLPRAYYSAIIFVIVLYVAISKIAVGNLPIQKIVDERDYALAAAARALLGRAGFSLIAIAAGLSMASAINATYFEQPTWDDDAYYSRRSFP